MTKSKNTLIGEKLTDAINENKNNINNYIWKYQNGTEVKMIDMPEKELHRIYNHCHDMLYNENVKTPGKYQIRKNIEGFYVNCNAELFLRYLLHELNSDLFSSNRDIINVVNKFREANNLSVNERVSTMFDNLPSIFNELTFANLIDACLDKLGVLNRKLISDKFIITLGIWLTEEEKKDLTEYDYDGNPRNKLDIMKERLYLNNIRLKIDAKGLNYKEFKSMIQLPQWPKIANLSTDTLKLLRNKVLLLLADENENQLQKWETIFNNIKKVAKEKDYKFIENED